jgi:hypothetical protein
MKRSAIISNQKGNRVVKTFSTRAKRNSDKPEIRERRRQDNVEDGDGQQELPSEIHQLIEAETRQRPAQPDIKKQEEENFN